MLALLQLATWSLTFTPVEFDGFRVPAPAAAGSPTEENGRKVWKGFVDAPSEAGYITKVGPWTNPYFMVRITDLKVLKESPNETEAVNQRLRAWNTDNLAQVMQRITIAKLGKMRLVVLNGSALEMSGRRRGLCPSTS